MWGLLIKKQLYVIDYQILMINIDINLCIKKEPYVLKHKALGIYLPKFIIELLL
jgi:hypothetical protein